MPSENAVNPINPWGSDLDQMKEWDPTGAALLERVGTNPFNNGLFTPKEVALIYLALVCACTNLDAQATRRQIRVALDAGASRDEILLVLKCGAGLAIHTCSVGAPILLEEMKAAGLSPTDKSNVATPACDAMRAMGQWNTAWDPFYQLAPAWTDQFFALGASIYKSPIFTPKFMELISIAFDASITHMYAPGIRRHIKGALKNGATPEEIMTVLQICASMGVESCAHGVPILAEELERK
jgi:alkylhydroperoxidase/carboxymuconolactone decarboxylase family protein YurZ